ncbi:hypothetical protein JHK87_052661 [Glycine soja]|nr:hypothetical protein JHK87_052661 [Glycine soja]
MGIYDIVLMCLRDIKHNKFKDSLIGIVETSLGQGPIYFNCYPNKTVSLMDRNILDSLFLNIHFHGLDMKKGSIPTALIYRIWYKANVSFPRIIKWDEVTLLKKWVMDKATPSVPRPAPTIDQIKQDNSGKVEITFNRRNSFSSRIEALRQSEYESARRPFSIRTRSILVGLSRSQSHNQFSSISLQGLDTTSSIPRTTYNQEPEDDQKSIQSPTYSSIHEPYGESISKEKVFTKPKDHGSSSSVVQMEKPLFKPFKVSKKAKQKFRELRKQRFSTEEVGDSNSELLSKINSLLKTIPETPQPLEESSKIRTRHTSKLINSINEDSDNNSKQVSEEEKDKNNFKSFSANIYEWNIDAQTEYNIMNTLQHMTMVVTAYQTSHECPEETIVDILVAGFSGQLKGWWDNYLTNEEKSKIYSAIKTDPNGKVITNDDNEEISYAVNTLIFTIAQHFIGDPSLWNDRSAKLLSNLKCRTLVDFRWYRDTFLTKVYTREDSQQPFWKEKFLAGLPRSLGDKVRDKIRSQSINEDISYDICCNLPFGGRATQGLMGASSKEGRRTESPPTFI